MPALSHARHEHPVSWYTVFSDVLCDRLVTRRYLSTVRLIECPAASKYYKVMLKLALPHFRISGFGYSSIVR